MTKAYWIGNMEVTDAAAYDRYRAANGPAFAKYQGRFLVRGGAQNVVEGTLFPRTVVIEFPNITAAQDCYHSPEYQSAKAIRDGASLANLCIVEGWTGA